MPTRCQTVFDTIRHQSSQAPLVVAHRGDSTNFAENTLPAFAAACQLGVGMQEFDVRSTRDKALVCIHDGTLDRTTDSASKMGPGALVASMAFAEVRRLDASSWHESAHSGAVVPSLSEVLDLLLPGCIAMIEHKAGEPDLYLAELRRRNALSHCILQSFDWNFLAAVRRAAPDVPLALLGPSPRCARLDNSVIAAAKNLRAGMVHWSDGALEQESVAAAHQAGLLVCSYTTDEDIGFLGGATMGIDAMCTNRPGRMMQLHKAGQLRRSPSRP